jgi:hypothetical protein
VRGWSVDLLLIDEAAQIDDALIDALADDDRALWDLARRLAEDGDG